MKIIQPEVQLKAYTCPYCNTLSQHYWDDVFLRRDDSNNIFMRNSKYISTSPLEGQLSVSTCNCCHNYEIWYGDKMLVPNINIIPLPLEEMPENVKEIYEEARAVYNVSKKSAAALLRLALQYLCIHLGGKGKNINDDIGKFVSEGLDSRVQKSLDILRITGNNAVHPGELDLNESEEITFKLFGLINFIVEKMIIEPKAISEFFDSMPEGAKNGVIKRDN